MTTLFQRIRRAVQPHRHNYYSSVKLSADDKKNGGYKRFLGGGQEKWESRGKFQLYFLTRMGLLPTHRFLDVGCGPIRGGVQFINYLEPGLYAGVDYNRDFIQTAKALAENDRDLSSKRPLLIHLDDFDFSRLEGKFDYVLAFSVLNHCDNGRKARFFRQLPEILLPSTRVYLTHAKWVEAFPVPDDQLRITRIFRQPEEIAPNLKMQEWGWPPDESIFPILELMSVRRFT